MQYSRFRACVFFLASMFAVGSAGCLRSGTLVAHSGEHRLLAKDPTRGIDVILTTGAWDGHPSDLEQDITAIHVLVVNHGQNQVVLAPGDIELVDNRGFRYELLDTGASFYPEGQSAPMASVSTTYARPGYERGRSRNFSSLRSQERELLESALPWGVLLPGTQMRGFLYFEKAERTANQVKLSWNLTTPDHRTLTRMEFNLFVARPAG